jgi:hypothetical protein
MGAMGLRKHFSFALERDDVSVRGGIALAAMVAVSSSFETKRFG